MTDEARLPADVEPDELAAVVETYGQQTRGWVAEVDDYVKAEMTVRAAYAGLPQIAEAILRARSWTERAKDLVADGWARIREIFHAAPKAPEPVPEPGQEEPDLIGDDWGDMMATNWREKKPDKLDLAQTEALNRSIQSPKEAPENKPGGSGERQR